MEYINKQVEARAKHGKKQNHFLMLLLLKAVT
jgi:hypothetical protein